MARFERTIGNKNHVFLNGHTDSVLCCAVDNNLRMVATGGVDEVGIVWDLSHLYAKYQMKGHLDSVIAVGFSLNSSYSFSADMKGYLQVCDTNTGVKVFDYNVSEIRWATFHNISENVLFAGTATGEFWMWHTIHQQAVKTFPSYGHATTGGIVLEDGGHIIIAYEDCSLRMFNLKAGQLVHHFQHPSKSEIIRFDVFMGKEMIAIGCLDARVRLIHAKKLKLLTEFHCSTPDDAKTRISREFHSLEEVPEQDMQSDDESKQKPGVPGPSKSGESSTKNASTDAATASTDPESDDEVPNDPIEVEEMNDEPGADDGDDESNTSYDPNDLSEAIEVVKFSRRGEFLLCCNNLGSIYVYDTERQKERCNHHLALGVTSGAWTDHNYFVLGCSDGSVRMFDPNIDHIQTFETHQDQILDLVYLRGLLATVSDDRCVAIAKEM